MKKLLITYGICILGSLIFSCSLPIDPTLSEMLKGVPSSGLIAKGKIQLELPKYIHNGLDACGICHQCFIVGPRSEAGQCVMRWASPSSDIVHINCYSKIKEIEQETLRPLGMKMLPEAYEQFHRYIVMFVQKLCSPYTIAGYADSKNKYELEGFFSAAVKLGFKRFYKERYRSYPCYTPFCNSNSNSKL